jgi:hypothetical protein
MYINMSADTNIQQNSTHIREYNNANRLDRKNRNLRRSANKV